jgi:hypothetical protein
MSISDFMFIDEFAKRTNIFIDNRTAEPEKKLQALKNAIEDINNYKLLVQIANMFINSPREFVKKFVISIPNDIKKNMIEIKNENGESYKVLKPLNQLEFNDKYPLNYFQTIENEIKKFDTRESKLCIKIITKINNINSYCVFNFIRHLAHLGILVKSYNNPNIAPSINLSHDSYNKYEQEYPYYLADRMSSRISSIAKEFTNSSFNANLKAIYDTGVYTNCTDTIESKTQMSNNPSHKQDIPQYNPAKAKAKAKPKAKAKAKAKPTAEAKAKATADFMTQLGILEKQTEIQKETELKEKELNEKKLIGMKNNESNENKYLKYKFKYLKLKNQMGGG